MGNAKEPGVVELALLVFDVELLLEREHVGREGVHGELQGGHFSFKDSYFGLVGRQVSLGLLDSDGLGLEHVDNELKLLSSITRHDEGITLRLVTFFFCSKLQVSENASLYTVVVKPP